MEPFTVTVQRTRELTGLGVTKLYELINEGKLKTVKVGRRTLIRTESIRELVGHEAA